MLAAAACAWGAAPFFGRRGGFVAGAVLGVTFLLSTEASIAKTDAALCGAIVLTQAALGRVYGASRGLGHARTATRALMWLGLALSTLIKGPIGPMVFALTLLGLWIADRELRWARRLGWWWGLAIVALIAGPWAAAITVQTDGAFWGSAISGDLAPKLAGADERHGGWPGYHLLVLPLATFPVTVLIPAALVAGWTLRGEPGVRFALAWLIPAWLVFELSPTKLPHYPLPVYGALAWLVAAALARPIGRKARWGGAALASLAGVGLAAGVGYLQSDYGDPSDMVATVLTGALFAGAGLLGAVLLLRNAPRQALAGAAVLGVLAHAGLTGWLIPRLEPLLLSPRTAEALAARDLDPRAGPAGPVEVAGYAEPSLVFLLGTPTGLGDAPEAAQAVVEGRPAVVTAEQAPAEVPREDRRGVTWLRPELVAEVAFTEFTAQGTLRHPSFIGLREDKKAAEVVPERAEDAPEPTAVKISSRDRVIYESGQTKGQLADYYQAIAPLMLPWAGSRPISLVRCPQGRGKKCFFQKHDSGVWGANVKQVPIAEKDGHFEDYIYIDTAEGLLTCVQMGTIEFHGWGSRVEDVELPDRMVIDLDPDEGLDFKDVKRAAKDIHDRLEDIGLISFAMLTGGKGIHVVVPLLTGHDWNRHKDFTRRFAEALAMAEPERFVSNMAKAKRVGKIFIDYLRNQRGATAVLPFSARSRPGAPVAAPIAWGELDGFDNAHPWSVEDADTLIRRAKGKGLAGWGFAEQALPDL